GTTKFWEKHCNAVSFVKVEASDSIVLTTESTGFQRKNQTCSRCKCKKYPGPSKSPENHKRSYCSDRFKPKLAEEQPALWPLPAGIFTTGTEFHPFVFLERVRKVYEQLVELEIKRDDLTLEDDALMKLLELRVVVDKSTGSVLPADNVPDNLMVIYKGSPHLYINSLRSTNVLN
ncbi:hypothetical protein C8R45DRAFT_826085, partial [Mycena sanguinolenta]